MRHYRPMCVHRMQTRKDVSDAKRSERRVPRSESDGWMDVVVDHHPRGALTWQSIMDALR